MADFPAFQAYTSEGGLWQGQPQHLKLKAWLASNLRAVGRSWVKHPPMRVMPGSQEIFEILDIFLYVNISTLS